MTRRSIRARAFTLLEMLLVLALMAVILVGLSATVRLFSRNYEANERKVGRAQLARSISQMLSDDLGAAVQDPISALSEDPTRTYARHFGLRGDARSLQIDVVQPSSFARVADVDENRRVAAGADKKPGSKQTPELKTVFYEFVPINSLLNPPVLDRTLQSNAESTAATSGSLGGANDDPSAGSDLPLFWDGFQPLVQKYGLTRRELDYETPDDNQNAPELSNGAANAEFGAGLNPDESRLAGSLTAPPDAANSAFAEGLAAQENADASVDLQALVPMTAPQIAMDADDGASWIPEALDCRFSYFDGTQWFESWDSIEKNGLPTAIKVELKLVPLDDVDLYRSSPMMLELPLAPDLDVIEKIEASVARDAASALSGSLTRSAADENRTRVDVFNSYRVPESYRAALEGAARKTNAAASLFDEKKTSANAANPEGNAQSEETTIGGALAGDQSRASASSANDSATGDAFLEEANETAELGAVYNDVGVCVDFANDGSYATLEMMAKELGLTEPAVFEFVAYLPTTPFSRAKTVERRVPTNTRAAMVNTRRGANSARRNRADARNPYATGVARAPRERSVNERAPRERTANDRVANERTVAERGFGERVANERNVGERAIGERQATERTTTERAIVNRIARERGYGEGTPAYRPTEVVETNQTPADTDYSANLPPTTNDAQSVGGGLGADAAPTRIEGLDPFAVVDDVNSTVPFAAPSSAFSAVDAALDVSTPGLVADPNGAANVAAPNPTTPNPTTRGSRQQQTWIRGKK